MRGAKQKIGGLEESDDEQISDELRGGGDEEEGGGMSLVCRSQRPEKLHPPGDE